MMKVKTQTEIHLLLNIMSDFMHKYLTYSENIVSYLLDLESIHHAYSVTTSLNSSNATHHWGGNYFIV